MKQLILSFRSGCTELLEIPAIRALPNHLVVRSRASLVSIGTERMLVGFGQAGYLAKARQQPEKVLQVIDKMKADGILATVGSVQSKLEEPIPLGYCNVGVVEEVGPGVSGFSVGDRVASNGNHAEQVLVAANLAARVPASVSDEDAEFAVLGSIGLQGLRLAEPSLGEIFAVIGLGLVGQMTSQLLLAAGCRVVGFDVDQRRVELARRFGVRAVHVSSEVDAVAEALHATAGVGVDGVIVSVATSSSDPIHQAAGMCRKKGRIVLVGVSGMELRRKEFFDKELAFFVSSSYGPGRYDSSYESGGNDYPLSHVRWTAGRNIGAVLDLMDQGKVHAAPLVSHRVPFEDIPDAYETLLHDADSLGILIDYGVSSGPQQWAPKATGVSVGVPLVGQRRSNAPRLAVVGTGEFARKVLLPAVAKTSAELDTVVSATGVSAALAARKFGFRNVSTDPQVAIQSQDVDAVIISTRHDSHARLVSDALRHGKDVFVEKPLALTREEVDSVVREMKEAQARGHFPIVGIGFNRRFAPHIVRARELIHSIAEPLSIVITVNAGRLPSDHWVRDPLIGGGRIIGEVCHFLDLARHLAGSPVRSWHADGMVDTDRRVVDDTVMITLSFENGSHAAIQYLCNGSRAYPKERVEIFGGGRVLKIDNFKKMTGFGYRKFRRMSLRFGQDKGHVGEMHRFIESVGSRVEFPIPFDEIVEVSCLSIEIADALANSG